MEERSELFGLSIDPQSQNHLYEASKWARFLAIVGFIVCGLIVLAGIFSGTIFSSMTRNNPDLDGVSTGFGGALSMGLAIVYVLLAVLYFFPCLFLFRFAQKMRVSLNTNSQDELNESFQNLKSFFRFFGILTIIILAIYVLGIAVMIIGFAAAS